jgi:hypothetical protein
VTYPSGGSQPSYRPQHGHQPQAGEEPQRTDPYQGWDAASAPYSERRSEYPRQVFPQPSQPNHPGLAADAPVSPPPSSWIDQPRPEERSWDDTSKKWDDTPKTWTADEPGSWGVKPRRGRSALKITLVVVAVLLVLIVGAGYALGKPILDEYPAKVAAGPSIAGFAQSTNPELVSLSQQMNTEFKAGSELDSTAAGVYHKDGDEEQKVIIVVAGSALVLRPQTELRSAFDSMTASGLTVTGTSQVDPGELGGVAQCGSSVTGGVKLAVCGWADHGSLGMIMFFDRGVTESAKLLLAFRKEIQSR